MSIMICRWIDLNVNTETVRLWNPIFHTMLRYSVLHPASQEQQDNVIVASVMKHNAFIRSRVSHWPRASRFIPHFSVWFELKVQQVTRFPWEDLSLHQTLLFLKNTSTQTRDVYQAWSERCCLAFTWIMHCVRRICRFTIWDVAGYEHCLHKSVLFWQAFNSKAG